MPQITKQYKFCAAHKYWNDKWDENKNKDVFDEDVKYHPPNPNFFKFFISRIETVRRTKLYTRQPLLRKF